MLIFTRKRDYMAVLLVAAGSVATHSTTAHGQSYQARPTSESLCGPTDLSSKPRVLIGRVTKVGDADPKYDQTLEYGFTGSLVGGLLRRSDATIYLWGRDVNQLKTFKELVEPIDNAFLGGVPREKERRLLAEILRTQNCQYLLGGRISQDGDAIGVTIYRLDASGTVERSTSTFGDLQSLLRSADRFAAEFGIYLQQGRPTTRTRLVDVGCITLPSPLLISRAELEQLAIAMRERLLQRVTEDKQLSIRLSSDNAVCGTANKSADDASLHVSAELRAARGTKDTIEALPAVRISDSETGARESIRLSVLRRSTKEILELPGDFADTVRTFLTVSTRRDGSLPTEAFNVRLSTSDLWDTLSRNLRDKNFEFVALVAYRLLAANSDDSVGSYMLGRALLGKERPRQALDYFLRAKQNVQGGWPLERAAELMEYAGNAQQSLKRPSESEPYYTDAQALYSQAGRRDDAARVGRALAMAFFVSDEKNRAFDQLRAQPDLEKDVETLRQLGTMSALSDQFDDAIAWFSKALAADPNADGIKMALADTHEAIGKKAFSEKRYPDARASFERAAALLPEGRRIYLAALPSYEMRDFADAASKLDRVVKDMNSADGRKITANFVDGTWLTLFETFLLSGQHKEIDERYEAALAALRPDARLLAAYLKFAADLAENKDKSATDMEKEPAYQYLMGVQPPLSARNVVGWNNSNVESYLAEVPLPSEKRALLVRAAEWAWQDPLKPKLR